jgi:hypothetical protein
MAESPYREALPRDSDNPVACCLLCERIHEDSFDSGKNVI